MAIFDTDNVELTFGDCYSMLIVETSYHDWDGRGICRMNIKPLYEYELPKVKLSEPLEDAIERIFLIHWPCYDLETQLHFIGRESHPQDRFLYAHLWVHENDDYIGLVSITFLISNLSLYEEYERTFRK